jgi:serine/threonine-protein kinase
MGSNDGPENEQPAHRVYLDEYWIKRTEVTNVEYARCVADGACSEPDNDRWNDGTYADRPVTNVSWYQANDYAKWVGGRLPTEAEWERACRGTDGRIYPWGNGAPNSTLLNYDKNVGDVIAAGSYPDGASPVGALDMAGNIWEWTADWYDGDYYANSPRENPKGPNVGTSRVLRGGGYYSNDSGVRCAYRVRGNPNYRNGLRGFRVVFAPPAP